MVRHSRIVALQNKAPAAAGAYGTSPNLLIHGRPTHFGVLAAEALHPSGGIDQFLLAGEERMAVGTDFDVNIATVRRARGEYVSARTVHPDFVVRRVNRCFHVTSEPFW